MQGHKNNDFIDSPSKIISSTANRINNCKMPTSISGMEELDKMKKKTFCHMRNTRGFNIIVLILLLLGLTGAPPSVQFW